MLGLKGLIEVVDSDCIGEICPKSKNSESFSGINLIHKCFADLSCPSWLSTDMFTVKKYRTFFWYQLILHTNVSLICLVPPGCPQICPRSKNSEDASGINFTRKFL